MTVPNWPDEETEVDSSCKAYPRCTGGKQQSQVPTQVPCIRATVMLSLLALKIIKQSVFYPGPSVVHVVSMNDHTPEEDLWMFCLGRKKEK